MDIPKRINVVHVIAQIGMGGAEMQLHGLIAHSDPGLVHHEVLYYSDSYDDEGYRAYARAGIPLTRVPRNKRRPLRFVKDLAGEIRRRRPDIVHCWLLSGTIWGRLGAMRAGARCIIASHRGIEFVRVGLLRLFEKMTGGRIHYLANTWACARIVAKTFGIPLERFDVIYNGIEVSRFQLTADGVSLRRELNIPNGDKLIVMVGRLAPVKNYPMLLEIARRCRGSLPVQFLVVGHGPSEAELLTRADALGVRDIVHFLGLRSDVERILASADIFCYTSLREGFPNAVLEAMMARLPIVTTDFAGVEELIEDGRTGVIVGRNDVEAAVAAVRLLIEQPQRAAELGATARQSVGRRFIMRTMVDQTMDYYHRLLAGQSRGRLPTVDRVQCRNSAERLIARPEDCSTEPDDALMGAGLSALSRTG